MSTKGTAASIELRAAQKKLFLLREQLQVERAALGHPVADRIERSPTPLHDSSIHETNSAKRILPYHLGWENVRVTALIRRTQERMDRERAGQQEHAQPWPACSPPISPAIDASASSPHSAGTVKLHPDLALGMLREEQTAAGRIWLLLHHIDQAGRGAVPLETARAALTSKDSALRVCGWRQLRNLLASGDGLFWQRQADVIWLRATAKVAAALGVRQLTGTPVGIPVTVFTQGIGATRAHLYASFHSGRNSKSKAGKQASMPIARQTIRTICRISRRTQRNYEAKAKVRRQSNFAVGPQASAGDQQELAWQKGRAYFTLKDQKGKQGASGATYQAWQLPNNYFGPHKPQPRGQQKRINRQLADLFMKGMTGNGEEPVDRRGSTHAKRFYGNGRLAAKAYNQPAQKEVYWCGADDRYAKGSCRIWHFLPGKRATSA